MKRYVFHLDISAEKCLEYYRGTVRQVVVRLPDGLTVQIPASLLKRFVTSTGIQGDFALTCDDDFKDAKVRRLSP